MAEMLDERTQAKAKAAATQVAASMPKVDPKTGQLPDLFSGKFGFVEILANDPTYGEEIRAIKAALEAQNETLALSLLRRSKWAQLDEDAQDRYLLSLQKTNIYEERLKSWMSRIKPILAGRGLSTDDATLEKYYKVTMDLEGKEYIKIELDQDYENRKVHLSMAPYLQTAQWQFHNIVPT